MAKAPNKQLAGIKAYAEQKNKETIEKVHKAIDSLKRKKKISTLIQYQKKQAFLEQPFIIIPN
ncbi:hypothetical protein Desor_2849 [Desulfosporosinus orientis DSM 765]|uniref:Uncharacterized protein n=1 Tax=Desulfosporosinus orientis (strain ATCC 19365 / DSM 765 / NCIMB 8382 / VKM B-1628 / Singapore I) TaxID=768706 RepID=G7WDQ5_DESOD|nr:hypothetical protein [Desulfosporosinus orientis]AET68380.1 hypothetical protein Desor_2849 [Desulfosporosinus orientis DSM 765]